MVVADWLIVFVALDRKEDLNHEGYHICKNSLEFVINILFWRVEGRARLRIRYLVKLSHVTLLFLAGQLLTNELVLK